MIVVIACAGSKNREAGRLKNKDGEQVEFVAHPGEGTKQAWHLLRAS